MIALWKSPFEAGDVSSACTDMPPADSPNTVTSFGLPPKPATHFCTHCSAAI
jgi:hypothetical protein